MATQTTNYVDELKINKLTTAQYETITTPSATELYFVTDGTISYNDLVDKPTLGSMAAEDKNDYVAANTAITGATKCKITYDSKGLVTAGADLAASDIPNLSLSKITDVTATAAEVNKLASLATTATELGYVHGVTSAIQTQLDDKVVKNTAITGATKTKITYDSKGLVTAGADLQASDIPSLTLAKISDVTASASELNILDGATLTTTELNYVDGVTSSIQDQLDAKQATITGAATTVVSSDLTASKAIISNASGKIAVSDTTSTELGYVHGVTSAIQTQIDSKVSKSGDSMTNSLEMTNGSIYLEGIGSNVAASTSRLNLGTPFNVYAYLTGNNQGAFGIYSETSGTRTGIACYPGQNFFADATTKTVDLGRSNNVWKTGYIDTLSNGASSITIANIIAKQDALVSGTNIKTINNQSVLGSGNLTIDSLPSQSGNAGKYLTTNGTSASWTALTWTYDSTTETLTII